MDKSFWLIDPPLEEQEIKKIIESIENQLAVKNIDSIDKILEELELYDIKQAPKLEKKPRRPLDIAEEILKKHPIITTSSGITYRYNSMYWEALEAIALEKLAGEYDSWKDTSKKRCQDTTYYLQRKSLLENIQWRNLKPYQIPFKNGILNTKSWKRRRHRMEDFLETVIPHDYLKDKECPTWLQCLDDWFGKDPDGREKIKALQMFFGYVLLPHAIYKKALLCFGPSNTGKSLVNQILTELVGQRNTCVIPLEKMGDPRTIASIKGKMLNIVGELKYNAMVADGGFKQLVSTEEPVRLDQKFKEAELYVPFCKHAIFTNILPTVNDYTEALFNRLLIIEFRHPIPERKQDKCLINKLRREMVGIALWAARGARVLYKTKGQFIIPDSTKKIIQEYKHEQNPVNLFLEEKCEVNKDSRIPMEDFRKAFAAWHIGRPFTPANLTKMLKSAGHTIKPISTPDGTKRALIDFKLKREDAHYTCDGTDKVERPI